MAQIIWMGRRETSKIHGISKRNRPKMEFDYDRLAIAVMLCNSSPCGKLPKYLGAQVSNIGMFPDYLATLGDLRISVIFGKLIRSFFFI